MRTGKSLRGGLLVVGLFVTTTVSPFTAVAQEGAAEFATLAQAINEAQVYEYGDSGTAMDFIRNEVVRVQRNPEARNDLANILAALLNGPNSTDAFRSFVCQQLYLIGDSDQIDELAPMLLNPKYAHLARYALEVIPDPQVDELLWGAISQVDGAIAAGMVSSLTTRGAAGTVTRLSQLLPHENEAVVTAALIGLGRLGGLEAEMVLHQALELLPEDYRTEIFEALLGCAQGYGRANFSVEAARLYEDLLAPQMPLAVRLGALHGAVEILGDDSLPLLVNALGSGEAPWIRAACGYIRRAGSSEATATFGLLLGSLTPELQVPVINALADRGDPVALDYVLALLESPEDSVVHAVVDALGALGNETQVELLLLAMMDSDTVIAEKGRASLVRMADVGVNGTLLWALEEETPEAQSAIIDVLAERRAVAAVPPLMDLARGEVGMVQTSAFQAIGRLARAEDIPALFESYLQMPTEQQRAEAGRALSAATRRIPPSPERSQLLTEMYGVATTSAARGGLLALYRELGDDTVLPFVVQATHSADLLEQQYAVEALMGWPTSTPLAEVLALAKAAVAEPRKRAALDAYVRMVRLPSERTDEERFSALQEALSLSDEADMARKVLAGLGELKSVAALDLAEDLMAREDIHQEAAIAAEKIRHNYYVVTASDNSEAAPKATDGDINTYWDSGVPQAPGQWLEIDMSRPATIRGIVLDASRTKGGYPRAYAVYVYSDAGEPGSPVATGSGQEGITEITFESISGRSVRIVQTGESAEASWVAHEIRILPH